MSVAKEYSRYMYFSVAKISNSMCGNQQQSLKLVKKVHIADCYWTTHSQAS